MDNYTKREQARADVARMIETGLPPPPGVDITSHDFALEFAGQSIANVFGSLDDLPEEIADAIAQQYLKSVLLLSDIEMGRVPKNVPFDACLQGLARLQANLKALPELVGSLREMRDTGRDDLFQYWSTLFLDDVKYGIKNAERKPQLLRDIERRFKKVREAKGLYRLLKMDGFLS